MKEKHEPGDLTIEWYEPEGVGVLLLTVWIRKGAPVGDIVAYLQDYHDSEEEWEGEWPRCYIEGFPSLDGEETVALCVEIPDDWQATFEEIEHIRNMAILISKTDT